MSSSIFISRVVIDINIYAEQAAVIVESNTLQVITCFKFSLRAHCQLNCKRSNAAAMRTTLLLVSSCISFERISLNEGRALECYQSNVHLVAQ